MLFYAYFFKSGKTLELSYDSCIDLSGSDTTTCTSIFESSQSIETCRRHSIGSATLEKTNLPSHREKIRKMWWLHITADKQEFVYIGNSQTSCREFISSKNPLVKCKFIFLFDKIRDYIKVVNF